MYGARRTMRSREVIEAWQLSHAVDREVAERVVERLGDPDTHVVLRSAGTGWMRVELVSGDTPAVGSLLYVNRLGLFEVTRIDQWRRADGERSRVLVMLGTLPSADDAAHA
jgi:hypothetical protein